MGEDAKTSDRILTIFDKYYPYIFSLLILVLFYPIASTPYLMDIDRQIIIDPLKEINGISDYWKKSFTILDVQPLRDLVLLFTIRLSSIFSFELYGLVNIIIWVFTVYINRKTLKYFISIPYSNLISLIILAHPLIMWTISWPSALKHHLAILFISLATLQTVRMVSSKNIKYAELSIIIYYLLALNSQPIIILFPLVFIAYLGFKSSFDRYKILTTILLTTMFLYLSLNYFYYAEVYPLQIYTAKLETFNLDSIAISIMGVSRSLTQILFPWNFSMFYSLDNPINLLGIPAFLLLIASRKSSINIKNIAFIFLLTLYPLLVIYAKETNIFVSDTYLIMPMISMAFIVSYYFFKNENKYKTIVLLFLITTFSIKSFYEAKIVISADHRFKYSYLREKNCRNSLAYAVHLLRLLKVEDFQRVGKEALNNHCALSGKFAKEMVLQVYTAIIYFEQELADEKKIEQLSSLKNKSVVTLALLEKLYHRVGDTEKAEEMKKEISQYYLDDKLKEFLEKLNKNKL